MRKLFILSIFIFLFIFYSGCGPKTPTKPTLWQKTFGGNNSESAEYVIETTDGSLIVVGSTLSYGTGGDMYVLKLTSSGDCLWTKTYGGTKYECANSVCQDENGNIIITGNTESFGNNGRNIYLIKTNNVGDPIVTKVIDGGYAADDSYDIKKFGDGFLITGFLNILNKGTELYIAKLDSDLNCISSHTIGGVNSEYGYSIDLTSDNGFIVAGFTNSTDNADYQAYFLKFDSSFNLTWSRTYGGENPEIIYSIKKTSDEGYIAVGRTQSYDSISYNAYIIKLDSNGDCTWSKSFGGDGADYLYSVIETDDGYIAVGETNSFGYGGTDVYLLKVDKNGNYLWHKTYGGTSNDYAKCIQKTNDGNFVIVGGTVSYGAGLMDVYVLKIDKNGNTGPFK